MLATGFSVKIGYGGHNFSGVTIGVDGRLYAAVADRGMNVTDRDGGKHYNPHSGAMIRCELDGSNFEIFAYGLRNVQEFAFDNFGNIFGVDNDGDFKNEKERLLYITQGSDTGWRTNWQYRGDNWLPWMDEGLSIPDHETRPAYTVPPLQLYKDGPAGFAFNPGTALNPFYRDHFFMTGFPARNLYAFKLNPDGASFRMEGEHTAMQGALMVGVGWSPSGSLYIADWSSSGYDMNEKGSVWKLDDPTQAGSTLRQNTARLVAQNWGEEAAASLRQHLSHPDQRVRMKAQFELVKRNGLSELVAVATDSSVPQLGRLHAIWGLGQMHRRDGRVSTKTLRALLADNDAEVRGQTAKIIGEKGDADAATRRTLRDMLADEMDRPRFFAAIALGGLGDRDSLDDLVAYLERDAADRFHRHAGIMGLAHGSHATEIAGLSNHSNREVRLAAVVALRRQQAAEVSVFLNDEDPLVVAEAASAIHDDESIPAALPALAELLASSRDLHERTLRRALSAALRLREAPFAELVADFAANSSHPKPLRQHALALLIDWLTPGRLDTVEGRFRPLEQAWPERIALSLKTSLGTVSKSDDYELAQAAWEASAIFGIQQSPQDLMTIFNQDTPLSAAALKQLSAMQVVGLIHYAHRAMDSKHTQVKQEALRIIAKIAPDELATFAERSIERKSVPDARVGIELMATLDEPSAIAGVRRAMGLLSDGTLDPGLSLDVLAAAKASVDDVTKTLFSHYLASKDPDDRLAPYEETLHGGDPEKGRKVFETSVTAQCTLCHRIGRRGSNVGPALTNIGQKEPRFILESLVDPGATVALGFGITSATLKSGETISGILLKSTPSQDHIKTPDGRVLKLNRADIRNRTPAMSSMPPMGTLMSAFELRDLMAFLQTLDSDK